jgi:hypothetical protein
MSSSISHDHNHDGINRRGISVGFLSGVEAP